MRVQGLEILLNSPPQDLVQHLTERQKTLWSMVARHYGNQPVMGELAEEESDDHPQEPPPKRPRGASKRTPAPRDQMKVLTNLKSLRVPEPYHKHIEKYGTDPVKSLNDHVKIIHQAAEPGYNEANIHLAAIRYTLQVQSRGKKDRARWLLHMLLYFDLANLKYPQGTGRIGSRVREEIEKLVKNRVDGLPLDQLSI